MKDSTNKGFWERFAFLYTRLMKKNDAAYDDICKEIEPILNREASVLELACGTGQLSFRLCDSVKSWEATDYSPKMIAQAKKNGSSHKLHFAVADATELPYEDHIFDVVVIANALHIMPDPDAALKEIHRILKPKGILFAPTFVYDPGYNPLIIWLMEKAGFHTFHKWTSQEFTDFISQRSFIVQSNKLLKGSPLMECVVIARARQLTL